MDHLGTGVITKLESGRFDNQYNVEITLLDGTKLTGYDGIQVYDKKKDGDIPKVWPLVKKSFTDGVPFSWKGNVKTSDTKAGMKVYATLVFAEGSDGAGAVTAQSPPPNASAPSDTSWGSPPKSDWGVGPTQTIATPSQPLSKDDYWERREAQDEARTREIESAWAIGLLINNVPADQLHQEVHRLIVFKHQIARELADG